MVKPLKYTANDTFPTTITDSVTDPLTGITTLTDLSEYVVAMEIDYIDEVVVVTAVPLVPPVLGKCQLPWAVGELREGNWEAKLTITNADGKKLSTEFLQLEIERDLTPR